MKTEFIGNSDTLVGISLFRVQAESISIEEDSVVGRNIACRHWNNSICRNSVYKFDTRHYEAVYRYYMPLSKTDLVMIIMPILMVYCM